MKIKITERGGIVHHRSCESFEVKSNNVANWLILRYKDRNKEMFSNFVTIKAESENTGDK